MDFTGDGINDILSGCYWSNDDNKPGGNPQAGYLMILPGSGGAEFEEAVPLADPDGNPLLNVKLTKEQEENYDRNNMNDKNICTSQHAVDYDGDGDLDLVTGSFGNSFFVFINSADAPEQAPIFDSPAQQLSIQSPDYHSDPHLYDWDGDGDLDLLTGGDSGGVFLSLNQWTQQEPKWSSFTCLIHGSTDYEQSTDNGKEIEPGRASRVWVTDFNLDGKPDLLVGDTTTIKNKAQGITQAEFERKKAAFDRKMQPLEQKVAALQQKYMDRINKLSKGKTEEEARQHANEIMAEMQEAMAPFGEQYNKLYQEQSKFLSEERTGHVWVYLQKSDLETSEKQVAIQKKDQAN